LLKDEWMYMEHWWNDTGNGKLKYLEKTCLSATFSTTNPHIDCTGIEHRPLLWDADDEPPDPWHNHVWHLRWL